ncbi:MAG: site-specific integrase [Ferrovum sp.]|nr:site-specific integrase [Ferrovum sp.]
MATIRKRGTLQWEAQVRKKGFPHLNKTFLTRADAQDWAKVTEAEMLRGTFQDRTEAEATTLHEALERYAKEVSETKKGKVQELWRIKAWQSDPLAVRSLASLRGTDFAQWRDHRLKQVAPATCRNDLALISHLFTIAAKEWGLAVSNPVKNMRLPSVKNNARQRRLEGDEEQRLFAALEDSGAGARANHWMLPLVEIAIETAMRQSELLGLRWPDVNLSKAIIRLNDTKNGTSRNVPLSSHARSILEALPRYVTGQVFPVTASAVKQSFSRACMRGGLKNFHFHDLRHEATSRLAEKLALHELMKVTGHKDTRMLARYYHPRAEDLAKKLG